MEVTNSPMVANIAPVKKPMKGTTRNNLGDKMPKIEITVNTAVEKNSPLDPAQRISPMSRSCTVMGAANMPSYALSNSRTLESGSEHGRGHQESGRQKLDVGNPPHLRDILAQPNSNGSEEDEGFDKWREPVGDEVLRIHPHVSVPYTSYSMKERRMRQNSTAGHGVSSPLF